MRIGRVGTETALPPQSHRGSSGTLRGFQTRSTTIAAAAVTLATFTGCGVGDPGGGLESADQPIIAGTLDTGDPAVVEVLAIKGNSLGKCSATLVTPRILLTAGHCVAEEEGATFRVFPGNDDHTLNSRDLLSVSAAVFDPQYGDVTQGHDLALIVLSSPMAVAPIPINRASVGGALGKTARYVGYGVTNGERGTGSGIKRQASGEIGFVNKDLIGMGANGHLTCNGDSGGPLFMDTGSGRESLIGVTSFGDETCVENGFFMRLDTQLAWVDEQIKKYDPSGLPPAVDGGAPVLDAGARDTQPAKPTPDASPAAPEPPVTIHRDAGAPATAADGGGSGRTGGADAEPALLDDIPDGHVTTRGCTCAVGAARGQGDAGVAGPSLLSIAFVVAGARWRRRRTS
jgi:V8-like Glu-specific endopeptidase